MLTSSILVLTLSYGGSRSKELLHALLPKRNTILLLIHLLNCIEYVYILLNLMSMFHKYLWFIVIMLVLLISTPIQYFHSHMKHVVLNHYFIREQVVLFMWLMSSLKINHSICSLNLIVLKTEPDQLVRPSTGHSFGPVQWIRPKDDWTRIEPSEPAVRWVNRTIQLYIYIYIFYSIKTTLFWSPLTFLPFLPATSLALAVVADEPRPTPHSTTQSTSLSSSM